jgi:hypothetical protein
MMKSSWHLNTNPVKAMIMKNPIFVSLSIILLFICSSAQAQDKMSWRKHVKLAEELYAKAQYADAGEHYRAAFKQKTKKKELAYKAGECFSIIRDYRNAADAWKNVKDENAAYPLIGLRYARCLKQNGEYEAASNELVNFLGRYEGADKATVSSIVQNELRGCELAAQMAVKGADSGVVIELMTSNINTPETEFAPFPFSDEALYFSSTMAKRAEIYRSIKSKGVWGKATPIENFPVIENDHFCNGTLTPDASRFYFTICKSVEKWGGLTTHCEIYVTRRVGKSWTTPERLPDYINEQGVTTTQPFVVHNDNTEILYFSSNRSGGMGGMDIWYTTREISSTANDFTLPINCGSRINTMGDEITPYYDKMDGTMYFASNGQVTLGGIDIFKVKGAKSQWQNAENVGLPFNSPADDFSFVKSPSGKSGFLVSNRTHQMEKISTTHEDIFEFQYKNPVVQWVARGEVSSKESREVLSDVEVALYEVTETGQRRFLTKIVSANGAYEFALEPSRKYYLEALKDGFFPSTYEFDTKEFDKYTDFGAPLYLEPYGGVGGEEPVTTKEDEPGMKPMEPETKAPAKTETPAKKEPASQPYVSKSKDDNYKLVTEAPRQAGTYYKIQIIAVSKNNSSLDHPRYSAVKEIGRLDTEYIMDRKLYRVLLADYATVEDAMNDLKKVKGMKDFEGAFIVEYKDGVRISTIEN